MSYYSSKNTNASNSYLPAAVKKRAHRRQLLLRRRRLILMILGFELLLFLTAFLLGRKTMTAEDYFSTGNKSSTETEISMETVFSANNSATEENSIQLTTLSQNDDGWELILINKDSPLPEDYSVPKLTKLINSQSIDSRVYPQLQAMMDAARAEGLQPKICSSYRTMEKQQELFNNKIQYYRSQGYSEETAYEKASTWVAIPGTSEHQAGLAVDIVSESYQILDAKQEQTPLQQWLIKNCADYGFILRYPSDKSDLTGINYEPWHYRYVGVEAAQEIMSQGICLEEYLEQY